MKIYCGIKFLYTGIKLILLTKLATMKTNKNKRRNKDIVKQNDLENPVDPQEAQNVTDSTRPLSGKETEHAKNKATEGIKQGKAYK
jgi:hypothetical protein